MTSEKEKADVMGELSLLRDMLEKNEQLFDLAEDDDMTEALIYERQGLMRRYSAAIKRAKALGAEGDGEYDNGGKRGAYYRIDNIGADNDGDIP